MRKDAREGGAASGGDDVAAFVEAVRGVRKLSGPRRVAPGVGAPDVAVGVRPASGATQLRMKAPIAEAGDAAPPEIGGEHWTLLDEGVDRRILRKLRAEDIPVEGRIDLHGLTRAKAAIALGRFIAASRAAGHRCLLIIHGRGLHSGGEGAALRDLVRNELSTSTHAGNVLACAMAPPSQGGSGATLVYLRR